MYVLPFPQIHFGCWPFLFLTIWGQQKMCAICTQTDLFLFQTSRNVYYKLWGLGLFLVVDVLLHGLNLKIFKGFQGKNPPGIVYYLAQNHLLTNFVTTNFPKLVSLIWAFLLAYIRTNFTIRYPIKMLWFGKLVFYGVRLQMILPLVLGQKITNTTTKTRKNLKMSHRRVQLGIRLSQISCCYKTTHFNYL